MTPTSSTSSLNPITPSMAQAVLDAMMAGETVVDPRCFGWRLDLIRGVDASSVLDVDGFSLHLERLEPEQFQTDLFGAVHVLESQRGQMAGPAVSQYVLADAIDEHSVSTLLIQMLGTARSSSADGGVLRVSALGSEWLGLDRPENGDVLALQDFLTRDRLSHADQGIFAGAADDPERYETLARFIDQNGTQLPAAQVLTGHESSEALAELDCLMLSRAGARLAADPRLNLSINVCRTTLLEPSWLALLDALISAHGSVFDRAVFEITEWPARAVQMPLEHALRPLSDRGLALWLDDFGAGLTSFNEAFIPGISALKIDRSLLRRCCVDDDAFGVLSLITAFARRQGKLCVAEGIETAQQRQFAEARGASHVQGFFSGRV